MDISEEADYLNVAGVGGQSGVGCGDSCHIGIACYVWIMVKINGADLKV